MSEKLRQAIENHKWEIPKPVTASFGIGNYSPDMSKEQLMKLADEALYSAKSNGRNRVEVLD